MSAHPPAPRTGASGGSPAELLRQAAALHQAGRLAEAESGYEALLAAVPNHFGALHMLGIVAAQRGRLEDAHARLARALAVNPASAEAHSDLANVLHFLGRFDAALGHLESALALRPDFPEALANRAAVQGALGRHADAVASCDLALARDPGAADAWNNRGVALTGLARHEEALADFERALAARPAFAQALHNRANALVALGRHAEALASCDDALKVAPSYADALNTRGVVLEALGRRSEALACFDRALASNPRLAKALQNRGVVRSYMRQHAEAAADLEQAFAAEPGLAFLQGQVVRSRLIACDWAQYDTMIAALCERVRGGAQASDPFVFLAVSDSPADQMRCARTWAGVRAPRTSAPLWRGERYGHERIRVAYLSADFHEHATAYLMAELFERHDRSRFEVTAVSWGPAADSAMRRRLMNAFEHFEDVRERGDREVAQWLRAREIDIAVDLKGYTYDARPGILAHRPAPVQVSYLGYPGTLAAECIDYILADEVVIPPEDRVHYSERVVYLPVSYQVNDRKRAIAQRTPTRAECGLPERGFVYCSFNNDHKIAPSMFDVWMRVLSGVGGSVLWLLEGSTAAPGNLRREAQARGVDPARLVFAARQPPAEHLARQRVADLFLDTLPYNAHTTASDALWAGLPVLTCPGRSFAGRVAASLLRAAGLAELVTKTLAEYEALAAELAREPEALSRMKARLASGRATSALFDAGRFARQLEMAYATMHARAGRGEAPQAFAVPPAA